MQLKMNMRKKWITKSHNDVSELYQKYEKFRLKAQHNTTLYFLISYSPANNYEA